MDMKRIWSIECNLES